MKIGELQLPLYLSYHASGIKVAQEATWVGLGWDLMAGGCINRVISGSHDDAYPVYTEWKYWENLFMGSFYAKFPTYGDNSCWNGMEENPYTDTYVMTLYQDLVYGMGEPDIFQATFCGHSLKFIVHPHTHLPVVVGENNGSYRIEMLDYDLHGWKITDGEGIAYYFEQSGAETVNPTNSNTYLASYSLTRMEHPQKGVITLEYEDTVSSTQMVLQPSLSQEYTEAEYEHNLVSSGTVTGGSPSTDLLGKREHLLYDGNTVCKKYLKRIATNLEKVDFYLSDREDIAGYSKKLDSLVISDYRGTVVKRITFVYDYFTATNVGGDYMEDVAKRAADDYRIKRLKLESVSLNGHPYTFGYHSTPLPYKTSYATDFWGYYNGQSNTSFLCTANLLERRSNPSARTLGDANRYANPDKAKACILERITYPTKGYTLFGYESNTFLDSSTWCPLASALNDTVGISYGGGLRIASISHHDSDGALLRRQEYDYSGEDGQTSGKLLLPVPKVVQRPLLVGFESQIVTPGAAMISSTYALDQWKRFTLSFSVKIPAFTSLMGTPVGYSRVSVKEVKDDIPHGTTVTCFHNIPATHYFLDVYLFDHLMNGKEQKRCYLDSNGRMVRQEEWSYLTPESNQILLNAFAEDIGPGLPDCAAFSRTKRYRIQGYPFLVEWNPLGEEHVTDYSLQGDSVVAVSRSVQYAYNLSNRQPSRIVRDGSVADERLVTEISYADSFSRTAAYDSLLVHNMVNLPVESIELRDSTVLSRSKNNYALFDGVPRLSDLSWAKGENGYEKRMQYTRYDADGNLLELVCPDGVTVSYLWSYNNHYPVAQVEGMSYEEVETILGSNYLASINRGIEGINQLRSIHAQLSSDCLVKVQSYKPLVGILGEMSPDGIIFRYAYDDESRLSQIMDINYDLIEEYDYNYKQ